MRAAWRRDRDITSPEDRLRIERVLATVRVFLAFVALVAVVLDPDEPSHRTGLTYQLLTGYGVLSVLVFLVTRFAPSVFSGAGLALHVIDVSLAVTVACLTRGPGSPFFVFFVFVLFAAAARWGLRETLLTGGAGVLLFVTGMLIVQGRPGGEAVDLTRVAMRAAYLLVLTLMLGFLAGQERMFRLERKVLSRVLVGIDRAASFSAGLRSLMEECATHFGASEVLLALEAPDAGRNYLWRGRPSATGGAFALAMDDLPEEDGPAYFSPSPDGVAVWYVRLGDRGKLQARGLVAAPIAYEKQIDGTFAAPLLKRHPARALLVADGVGARQWRARFILLEPSQHTTDALRFLRLLVSHVSPALYNQYLVRRLRSRVSAMERARIARELHDGLIQSLIGLEMEIEVLRRQAGESGVTEERLRTVRDQLRRNIGDVRDLMLQLRPTEATGRNVLRLIAEQADRLRREVGLEVRLLSTVHDLDCQPRTCRELARIVQEALANVRKHSGARGVTITLSQSEASNRLVIEDDGRGIGFTGRWSLEQLEASERGPAVLKERVRAMGGGLVIDSQPGRGTRIEVEWARTR